jgi:hypothetical protein
MEAAQGTSGGNYFYKDFTVLATETQSSSSPGSNSGAGTQYPDLTTMYAAIISTIVIAFVVIIAVVVIRTRKAQSHIVITAPSPQSSRPITAQPPRYDSLPLAGTPPPKQSPATGTHPSNMPQFCPYCGAKVPSEANLIFCPVCGGKFD